MALSYRTTLRNTRLDDISTDVGSNGYLRIYSGTAPANVGTALSGNTLLAELRGNASGFAASASGGVLTLNAISADVAADATGTASFFRWLKSDGTTAVFQGTVGTSGADLNFSNTVSITSGVQVSVTSWTITEGNP